MKKSFAKQILCIVCISISLVLFLLTVFNFNLSMDGETYNLSELEAEEFEDYMSETDADEFLSLFGVGAEEDYNVFTFSADLVKRIMQNVSFFSLSELGGLVIGLVIRNLFIYIV